ncbi:MAG: SDR family oxidoreductase, partial [Vicinamibacterales bacterium]
MKRVLVTGARGLLGAAIAREFSTACDVIAFDRAALDITDRAAVARAIADGQPDVVINCAAFNQVDVAEDDAPTALAVNAFGVLSLSELARQARATLVHYSTDFVFDGQSTRPYTEEDRPNPRGTYAASKLLGDWFALEHPQAYVLRVESLFGPPGLGGARQGSLGTIIGRIRAGEPVPVFT